ncbi:MAG: DNA primase [Isosphaera sp.]|nr:DNA primase [Isosphaera sp.]
MERAAREPPLRPLHSALCTGEGCPVPSDPVELTRQIKAASDIVAVVGSYLAVEPAGAVFKALCPFHQDSRPSLDVDPKRQRYRCWACGQHGDAFAFVQHMEKVGFVEARAILAERAGIKLDAAEASPHDQHRTRLLAAMRWAQAKYQHALLDDPVGEAARKYLGGRKLSGKTVRDFGLGFAPLAGDWLVRLAAADRVPSDVLVEVGLTAPRQENRGFYDRFRDRVVFPIRDVRGQTIAFGGRIMPESPYAARAPKYYNSADTPLFKKSEVVFGLDLARHEIASTQTVAVVEGYTDVMMAHQCGITNVVSTMGTAFGSGHVQKILRAARFDTHTRNKAVLKVVLVYDADAGGFGGVDRSLPMFIADDVELAIAVLPDGLDPCDLLVRADGVDTFRRVLASAVDALDFKLNTLLEREGATTVEGTRRVVEEVLDLMASAPSLQSQAAQVKQELIVTRLAHRLGLRQETVWARLGELKAERRRKEQQAAAKAAPAPAAAPREAKAGPAVAAERQLLEIVLADPGLVPRAADAVSPDALTHTGLRRLLAEVYAAHAAGLVPDLDVLRERLADRPDLFESAQKLQFVGQHMQDRDEWLGRILGRFVELGAEAERKLVREQLASATGDEAVELLRRLQETHGPRKNAG